MILFSSSSCCRQHLKLSWELRNLAFTEQECKAEYLELRRQCQQFAVDLLGETRSSHELAIILNYDPESAPYHDGDVMKLKRLEMAIDLKQKKVLWQRYMCAHIVKVEWRWLTVREMCGRIESCLGTVFDIFVALFSDPFHLFQFVSHPNIQQLLASLWYEGVTGFRRKTSIERALLIAKVAVLFPYYCLMYMLFPYCKAANFIRKPFMKFLIHASSYLFFLCTSCIYHTIQCCVAHMTEES